MLRVHDSSQQRASDPVDVVHVPMQATYTVAEQQLPFVWANVKAMSQQSVDVCCSKARLGHMSLRCTRPINKLALNVSPRPCAERCACICKLCQAGVWWQPQATCAVVEVLDSQVAPCQLWQEHATDAATLELAVARTASRAMIATFMGKQLQGKLRTRGEVPTAQSASRRSIPAQQAWIGTARCARQPCCAHKGGVQAKPEKRVCEEWRLGQARQ
mmetsp:Transcript_23239/g.69025  ORF Transcript_23239/g.69025 Transcript_23239/m.69025 type:complete len:216 (+) Transcript_23239:1029-1676(+)